MTDTALASTFWDGLRAQLRDPHYRVITIDGEAGVGKTTPARKLGECIGAGTYDLDTHLNKKQGCFLAAIDWNKAGAAVEAELAQRGKVILSGVCMGGALRQLSIDSSFRIYIDARSTPDEQ